MSQGTTFRIIAFDASRKLSEEETFRLGVIDRQRSFSWGEKKSESQILESVKKEGGMPRFLPILDEQTEEEKQYSSHHQKEDPFPLWVDTETRLVGHELLACDFTSDFDQLEEHFSLRAESPDECVEITKEQVKEMLHVLDYIKFGKYDRGLEEIFFSDNEFFGPLTHQFFNFSMRFKNKKKDDSPIVKVVIKDERTEIEKERDEEAEIEEEIEESRRDETATIDYLRSILSTFLLMVPEYHYRRDEKIVLKLAYFKWI